MSRPSQVHDANFNEIYGTMYHEEDRRKTHYRDSRDHYNNTAPLVSMPYYGRPGDSSDPGTVTNIGFASGNVNTGKVYGTLQQNEGKRRTHKNRPPSHTLPSSFPPTRSPRPPNFSDVSRQGPPYHEFKEGPLHEEPHPARSHHPTQQGPQSAPPHYPKDGRLPHSHKRGRHGRDVPDYFDDDHGYADHGGHHHNAAHPPYHQEEPQNSWDHHSSHQQQQLPAMKSRNPFRNLTADSVPASQPTATTRRPAQQRAATTDYTSNWVTSTSAYSYAHPPQLHRAEEQREDLEDHDIPDIQWSLRSPSEYSSSSSSSSSRAPDYWSRAASRSSGTTSYSRCSPVPEEHPNGLSVRKPRSRSSTPGLL